MARAKQALQTDSNVAYSGEGFYFFPEQLALLQTYIAGRQAEGGVQESDASRRRPSPRRRATHPGLEKSFQGGWFTAKKFAEAAELSGIPSLELLGRLERLAIPPSPIQENSADAIVTGMARRIRTELATLTDVELHKVDGSQLTQVYSSWHSSFQRIREMLASRPLARLGSHAQARDVAKLALAVLNTLRSHLTRWQAPYRHWHEQTFGAARNAAKAEQAWPGTFRGYAGLKQHFEATQKKLARLALRADSLASAPAATAGKLSYVEALVAAFARELGCDAKRVRRLAAADIFKAPAALAPASWDQQIEAFRIADHPLCKHGYAWRASTGRGRASTHTLFLTTQPLHPDNRSDGAH